MKNVQPINADDLKVIVKEKYAGIAERGKTQSYSSCCGSKNTEDDVDYTIFSDDYSNLKGYNPEADLNLGCGIPTEHAGIKIGHDVLDLGLVMTVSLPDLWLVIPAV